MTPRSRSWERFVLLLVAAGAAFVSAAVLDALRMRRVIRGIRGVGEGVGEPTAPASPTVRDDRRTRTVQAHAPVP